MTKRTGRERDEHTIRGVFFEWSIDRGLYFLFPAINSVNGVNASRRRAVTLAATRILNRLNRAKAARGGGKK